MSQSMSDATASNRKPLWHHLYFWVLVGISIGILIGLLAWGFLREAPAGSDDGDARRLPFGEARQEFGFPDRRKGHAPEV